MRSFSRRFSSVSSLADTLKAAGCSPQEVEGWSKEMQGWSDHSVKVFVEKLAHLNGARPKAAPLPQTKLEEEQGPYVNPVTGEIGGPRGPEPTRFNDWSYKGRCTDF